MSTRIVPDTETEADLPGEPLMLILQTRIVIVLAALTQEDGPCIAVSVVIEHRCCYPRFRALSAAKDANAVVTERVNSVAADACPVNSDVVGTVADNAGSVDALPINSKAAETHGAETENSDPTAVASPRDCVSVGG